MTDMAEADKIQDIVYSLAASPDFGQDGVCFAARPSGLSISDDGGLTWRDAYASLELEAALTTAAVAVSPNFDADRSVFAGVPGGILRSIDGGQSWHIASLPPPPPFVSALVVSPNFTHDGILLAGTLEDGVFRSGDRGMHWAAWNFGLQDLNVLCMAISSDFANDETLFVGTESGIFRSTNGGRAWREVDFPTDLAPVLSLALSPHYTTDRIVFAGTEEHGLWCSEDGGRNWTPLGEELIAGAVNGIILSLEFQANLDVLAVLHNALRVSRDGGQSWSDWPAPLPTAPGIIAAVAPEGLDPDASLLVGMADGRVLRV